jgi:hypothetical protein
VRPYLNETLDHSNPTLGDLAELMVLLAEHIWILFQGVQFVLESIGKLPFKRLINNDVNNLKNTGRQLEYPQPPALFRARLGRIARLPE